MKVQWESFMMARVLDRTPMRDPGGGKVNLESEEKIRDASRRDEMNGVENERLT